MDTVLKLAVPTLGLVLCAAFLVGGCAHRRGVRHGKWADDPRGVAEKIERHVDGLLDQLDATDDQRARVHAIRERLLPDLETLVPDRGTLREGLLRAWKEETLDAGRLHRLVDDRSAAVTRFAHDLVEATAELHAVLTPEQRVELAKKMERRRH